MNPKLILVLGFVSIGLALALGLLDRETTSFSSLFAEPGNLAGLSLYALLAFFGGLAVMKVFSLRRSHRS